MDISASLCPRAIKLCRTAIVSRLRGALSAWTKVKAQSALIRTLNSRRRSRNGPATGFDRLRSDYTEFRYSAVDRWTETRRFRLTQDGILNSRLQIPVRSADEPWITIWRKAPIKHPSRLSPRVQLFEEVEIDLTPLRLALRPSRTAPDWSPENCQVISEDAFVGNVHCIQLQMDKVDHSERCWVDPQRDYSVVRWQRRR